MKFVAEDVTDKWEPKTRGGYAVHRVERIPRSGKWTLVTVCDDPQGVPTVVVNRETDGNAHNQLDTVDNTKYDLIPRRTPNPLEGLPLGHWWRRLNSKVCGPIDGVDCETFLVHIAGLCCTPFQMQHDWQHTADPTDLNAVWVTGWEVAK